MIFVLSLCVLMFASHALAQNLDNPYQRYDGDTSTILLYHFDADTETEPNEGPARLFGNIIGGQWVPDGRFGGGMLMDGDSRIDPARTNLFTSDNLTMELWVYLTAHDDVVFLMDTTKVDEFGQYGRVLGINAFRQPFAFALREGSPPRYAASESPLAMNQWVHVAGIWDEDLALVEIYVNGELAGTDDLDTDEDGSDRITICNAQSIPVSRGLVGKIDEVRVSRVRRYLNPMAAESMSWGAIKALY